MTMLENMKDKATAMLLFGKSLLQQDTAMEIAQYAGAQSAKFKIILTNLSPTNNTAPAFVPSKRTHAFVEI